MQKIILDTNFLMIPVQFKVDIYSEIDRIMTAKYKIYTLDRCIWELDKITKTQKGKDKEAAQIAKKIAQKKQITILKTDKLKNVDKILLQKAEEGAIIATQDKLLKKALKNKNSKIITLKQKKYLTIEE